MAAEWWPRRWQAANRSGQEYPTGRAYRAPRIYGASSGWGKTTVTGLSVTGQSHPLVCPFLLIQRVLACVVWGGVF
ncbi:UNVERIFIED_CONTAM: hypothetical protein Sangu_0216700 [Sesamum angustifolium]|uniref:Uncharacterized protein n=1 Tax=Sesamum angustifolium TaxID=2727405 RepID=A0AAW2RNA6_9LAMI